MSIKWKNNDIGIFEEIEKELEEMNKIMNSIIKNAGRQPGVYGFYLQVGPDGVPHMEGLGNMKPEYLNRKEISEENLREPFVSSIIDEKNNMLKITAEMPGIEKKDIELNATENDLMIKTTGERKYYKIIPTPCPVDPDSSKAKYNNGLLEVTLKLKETAKPDGKSINID